jgi:alpha-aminoadipate carrier protein LysW
MATCPECDAELDVDEYDVDKGDIISCNECGTNLEVTALSPLKVAVIEDDDDEDFDEDEEEDEDSEDADEDDEDFEDEDED